MNHYWLLPDIIANTLPIIIINQYEQALVIAIKGNNQHKTHQIEHNQQGSLTVLDAER